MPHPNILEQLREFDGPLLANTLDFIDPTPAHERYMSGDIASVTPQLGPTVGVAVTCRLDTSSPGGTSSMETFYETIDAIEAMAEPVVWVVEASGSRFDHECTLGDGMAKLLYAAGCGGCVTNGRARDVAGLLTTSFATYCRGTCVHHGALRCTALNAPVSVGGITIKPGDIIHAGAEGVITIPPASAETLIKRAPQMRALEHDAHCVLRRTDIKANQKQRAVAALFEKYEFTRG